MHWKTANSPRIKESKTKQIKVQAIVDCLVKGVVMEDWVPEGSTVNQYYYKHVLEKLREDTEKKNSQFWKNEFILHHDNAPVHTTISQEVFSGKTNSNT